MEAALCINGMQPATHVLDPSAKAGERIRLEIDVMELDHARPGCPDEPACCHSMPALQTGHLVLHQTVSVELIPDLVVLEPQRLEKFDNHKNLGCPQGFIRTFGARTQSDMAEPCAYFAE
jgi:hypothetical protein